MNREDATECRQCGSSLEELADFSPTVEAPRLRLDEYVSDANAGRRIAEGYKYMGITAES